MGDDLRTNLAKLRAMVEAMSPAPWSVQQLELPTGGDDYDIITNVITDDETLFLTERHDAGSDARAIAALRNVTLEMIDVIEECDAPVAKLRALRDRLSEVLR